MTTTVERRTWFRWCWHYKHYSDLLLGSFLHNGRSFAKDHCGHVPVNNGMRYK